MRVVLNSSSRRLTIRYSSSLLGSCEAVNHKVRRWLPRPQLLPIHGLIAIEALVLGGPESVRDVCFTANGYNSQQYWCAERQQTLHEMFNAGGGQICRTLLAAPLCGRTLSC